jgi:hypothetical protein
MAKNPSFLPEYVRLTCWHFLIYVLCAVDWIRSIRAIQRRVWPAAKGISDISPETGQETREAAFRRYCTPQEKARRAYLRSRSKARGRQEKTATIYQYFNKTGERKEESNGKGRGEGKGKDNVIPCISLFHVDCCSTDVAYHPICLRWFVWSSWIFYDVLSH